MLVKNKTRIIVAIMALIIVAIVFVLIFKPQKAVSDDIYSNRDSKFEKLAKIEKQENILEKNLDEGYEISPTELKKNMRAYGHNVKQIKKNDIDVYNEIEN